MFGRKKPEDEQDPRGAQPGGPAGAGAAATDAGATGGRGGDRPAVAMRPGSGSTPDAARPAASTPAESAPGRGGATAADAPGSHEPTPAQVNGTAHEPGRPAAAAPAGSRPPGGGAASAAAAGAPGSAAPASAATGGAQAHAASAAPTPARFGAAAPLTRTLRPGGSVDLSTVLGPLTLPNPVMTASGCAANGPELQRFFDVSQVGAFVTKTVLAQPRSGRGTPRMAETDAGMINSIGLQGPGIEAFVTTDLPWLMQAGARVIVSIAGNDPREFAAVAKTLVESQAFDACVGVEVNISCPNVANRGLVFACDPAATTEVIDRVRTHVPPGIPIFVKLSPDVTDIVQIARAAVHAGADALVMINTLLGLEIDTATLRPAVAGITGGLSGPAIRPVALRAVWQVYAAMQAGVMPTRPIVGVGGIRTGEDALSFLAAGASAVQVGTAIFNDPHAPIRVRDELGEELRVREIASPADVVGIAHTRIPGRDR